MQRNYNLTTGIGQQVNVTALQNSRDSFAEHVDINRHQYIRLKQGFITFHIRSKLVKS